MYHIIMQHLKLLTAVVLLLFCNALVYADETCDEALAEGKKNYNVGQYQKAKELFQFVQGDCGSNYKDVQNWINKCDYALTPTTLSASPMSVYFSAAGGSDRISVNCNRAWKRGETSKDFYSVTQNGNMLTVNCSANPTTEDRSGYIVIKSADATKSVRIFVTQSGQQPPKQSSTNTPKGAMLSLNKSAISCSADGKTEDITVTCRDKWSIEHGNSEMFTTTKNGNSITVKIHPNTSTEVRSDYFNVVCDDVIIRVSLSQMGKFVRTLSVNKNSIACSSTGTTEYITVNSNSEWELVFPQGDMYSVTRTDNTLKVVISPNNSEIKRSDFFHIQLKDEDKTIKVTLQQAGKPAPATSTTSTSLSAGTSTVNSSRSHSHRSSYRESAYRRYTNNVGRFETTWWGFSAGGGTAGEISSYLFRFRLGPIELRPLEVSVRHYYMNYLMDYADIDFGIMYEPALEFYIPASKKTAVFFGGGPLVNIIDSDINLFTLLPNTPFHVELGIHCHYGRWTSSDIYIKYGGQMSFTVGFSLQWSTGR